MLGWERSGGPRMQRSARSFAVLRIVLGLRKCLCSLVRTCCRFLIWYSMLRRGDVTLSEHRKRGMSCWCWIRLPLLLGLHHLGRNPECNLPIDLAPAAATKVVGVRGRRKGFQSNTRSALRSPCDCTLTACATTIAAAMDDRYNPASGGRWRV